jgi:hypothetical protein
MLSRRIILVLGTLTSLGIIGYWLTVLTGLFPVVELVPGYRAWFLSFPVADLWIAFCSALMVWCTFKQDERAALFGGLTGSGLIFLGLYAFAYGINTGLLFHLTIDEIIEIAIKLYCLSVGPLLIVQTWKLRTQTDDAAQSFRGQPSLQG